jgi:hypothetical protein
LDRSETIVRLVMAVVRKARVSRQLGHISSCEHDEQMSLPQSRQATSVGTFGWK